MESVLAAAVTGMLTLARSRAVMEVKLDALTSKVEKHNQVLERTYKLEQDMAVAQNDIVTLYRRTEEDK